MVSLFPYQRSKSKAQTHQTHQTNRKKTVIFQTWYRHFPFIENDGLDVALQLAIKELLRFRWIACRYRQNT